MDIMQFTRELLEDKDLTVGVRGIVTHAIRVYTDDPQFPSIWLIQHETCGSMYSDIFVTRDEKLKEIHEGDELVFHKIAPEKEGYPVFMGCSAPIPPQAKEEQKEEFSKLIPESMLKSIEMDESKAPDPVPFNASDRDSAREREGSAV